MNGGVFDGAERIGWQVEPCLKIRVQQCRSQRGNWRQRDEMLKAIETVSKIFDHLLDEKISKRDAAQTRLTVRN